MGRRVSRGSRSSVAFDPAGKSSRTFESQVTASSDSVVVIRPASNGIDLGIDIRRSGMLGLDATLARPGGLGVSLAPGTAALMRRFGLHRITARPREEGPVVFDRIRAGVKRAIDIIVSATAITILAPVWLVIAAAVAMTSEGPIIYRQIRVGRDGRPFEMLKFRSMVADAAEKVHEMNALAENGDVDVVDAPAFKCADDPRVTPVGRIIRRASLDELPQLLNVLRGHMSLVGPRPIEPVELNTLPPDLIAVRQAVRPGLTCLWQVLRYDGMSFGERIELDLTYVRRRSLVLDLVLLILTPIAILSGEGAF